MLNIFSSNYLARKPIEKAMQEFAKKFDKNQKVLDVGCGYRPYKKFFDCQYIGLDPVKEVEPDMVANAWEVPCENSEFDGIILNQSLEHITETQKTISEIKRILKPNGLCIVTVPQTMKNHGQPIPSKKIHLSNFDKEKIPYFNIDYYRFTKFGLIALFKDFDIVYIKETSGYLGTILQLMNYFFSSFGISFIFIPIFFINNILGIFFDSLFNALGSIKIDLFRKFKYLIYNSLTLNYILIMKNNDTK